MGKKLGWEPAGNLAGAWQVGDFKSSRRWPPCVLLDQARLSRGGHSPGPEAGTGEGIHMEGAPSPFRGHMETRANSIGSLVHSTANLCKPALQRGREMSALEPEGLRFKSQVRYLSAGWPGAADLTPQFPHLELL